MAVTRPALRGAQGGGEGACYVLRVCGVLLHAHHAAAPVPVVPVCRCWVSVTAKPVTGTPPPFFRRCVCERRILPALCPGCRAGALCPGCRSCYACSGVCPIWLLRYVLPLAAVYTTLRPYISRCCHCARCASYMRPICVHIAQAPALDHVQRERLRYVMRLFGRSCVRLCVLLRVRAMRADILPRRCQ